MTISMRSAALRSDWDWKSSSMVVYCGDQMGELLQADMLSSKNRRARRFGNTTVMSDNPV